MPTHLASTFIDEAQQGPLSAEGGCSEGDRVRAIDDVGAASAPRLGTVLRVAAPDRRDRTLLDVGTFVLVEWDDGDIDVLPVDRTARVAPDTTGS